MTPKSSLLIKFGELEHLKGLLSEGILHCKSIKWFAEHEDEKLRGDEFEAVFNLRYMEDVVIELKEADSPKGEWKSLSVTNALYKEYHKEPLGNLFCMSKFPVREGVFKLDERCIAFGGHFILVHNQVEFFRRVEVTLNAMSMEFCRGEVEYLNLHKHTGEKKLYQKDLAYSFQYEYRIHLHRDFSDTFEFSIGTLENIATIYSCDEVKGFLVREKGLFYEYCPLSEV